MSVYFFYVYSVLILITEFLIILLINRFFVYSVLMTRTYNYIIIKSVYFNFVKSRNKQFIKIYNYLLIY